MDATYKEHLKLWKTKTNEDLKKTNAPYRVISIKFLWFLYIFTFVGIFFILILIIPSMVSSESVLSFNPDSIPNLITIHHIVELSPDTIKNIQYAVNETARSLKYG